MKRLIAVLLTLALAAGLVPAFGVPAFAETAGPVFSGHSLVLENDIAIRYYVSRAAFDGAGFTEPQVNFSFKGTDSVATEYVTTEENYCFIFRGVYAHEMTIPVTATLTALSGGTRVTGSTITTSVEKTCRDTLALHGDDVTLCRLIADLLVYGAKSQAYFGSEEPLATANLTADQLSFASSATPELNSVLNTRFVEVPGADVEWYGANLVLKDSVHLKFYFKAPTTESLLITLTDESGAVLASYTEKDVTPSGDYYRICYDGFNAAELRKTIYAKVTYGLDPAMLGDKELPVAGFGMEGVGSNTLSYSVESYAVAARNLGRTDQEKLNALLDAMMRYGVSAEKYMEEAAHPSDKTLVRAQHYFEDPAFDEEVYYVGASRDDTKPNESTSLVSLLLDLDGDAYNADNNNQNKKTIYVDEGEYNFFAEYMAEVYDAETNPHGRLVIPLDTITTSYYLEVANTTSTFLPVDKNAVNADGQKLWLNAFVPHNTKIIGLGSVTVHFEPEADEISYGASRTWSPFNIFGSVMIENIDVVAHNCRYALHNDDHNRYLGTVQYYKDFNLTFLVSDPDPAQTKRVLGFSQTVGFGVNDDSLHVFDQCTIYNNTTEGKYAYYGHNASGTNPGEAEILLTRCNISTANANPKTIRLQTLSKTNPGHVITTIDRCTVNGGLELHVYYAETIQSFDVTFVETPGMPITHAGDGKDNTDPYTVKYVDCSPA